MTVTDDTMTAPPERLVPVALWVHENRRIRAFWLSGSPNLTHPDGLQRWLRRHEERLTASGAVMRLGNAWRLVEPACRPVMFEILAEESARAAKRKRS
ncbi:protein of unknown function [Burkholderia multivorans]